MIFARFSWALFCTLHCSTSDSEHFYLQQPPPAGARQGTICSVTSSEQESQQTCNIPIHMKRAGASILTTIVSISVDFTKAIRELPIGTWNPPMWVLIPELTWNVTPLIAPLLFMAVVPTDGPSWGQTLQGTATTTNSTFCSVQTQPAVQTGWSWAGEDLWALLKSEIECLVLG